MIRRKEIVLFLGFYIVSTLIYYTASWVSWGAFQPGHPSYLNIEEFFASGGAQFLISLLMTIPIWYITFQLLKKHALRVRLLSHLIFLPIYIFLCYFILLGVKNLCGWKMYWGGYKVVWTVYMYLLFYLVQFGFMHAYSYFMKFKAEERDKSALREAVLQSEIEVLKSQLSPHFLHNLFNSINASIPPENENTRKLIVQVSDLFRYQNYASQKKEVTIKEEVKFIENYLQLMKTRLKERLEYKIDVDESLYCYKIVPMLLQPLVENAVTHGISPKIEPSQLVIRIKRVSGKVNFSIEDTGIGIAKKSSIFTKGLGLSNTRLRLNKIYNSELSVKENYPSGTKIAFTI